MTDSLHGKCNLLCNYLFNNLTWETETSVLSGYKEHQDSEMWNFLMHTQRNLRSQLLSTKSNSTTNCGHHDLGLKYICLDFLLQTFLSRVQFWGDIVWIQRALVLTLLRVSLPSIFSFASCNWKPYYSRSMTWFLQN